MTERLLNLAREHILSERDKLTGRDVSGEAFVKGLQVMVLLYLADIIRYGIENFLIEYREFVSAFKYKGGKS